jgi:membrane associated rhomboid family serine protease
MNLSILKDVIGRMVALFLTSAAGVVTGAAALAPELTIAKSCAIAGVSACIVVLQKLASASLDGNLTKDEVDAAFGIKPGSRNNDQQQ